MDYMIFLKLPLEDVVFPKIFCYLSLRDLFTFRGLSKSCREMVIQYFATTHKLDLCPYRKITESGLTLLSNETRSLKTLKIKRLKYLTTHVLKKFFVNNVGLKHVTVCGCKNLSNTALHPLIIKCKDLKSLDLSWSHWLTDESIFTLACHQKKLEYIDFSRCPLSHDCLIEMRKNSPKLKKFFVKDHNSFLTSPSPKD